MTMGGDGSKGKRGGHVLSVPPTLHPSLPLHRSVLCPWERGKEQQRPGDLFHMRRVRSLLTRRGTFCTIFFFYFVKGHSVFYRGSSTTRVMLLYSHCLKWIFFFSKTGIKATKWKPKTKEKYRVYHRACIQHKQSNTNPEHFSQEQFFLAKIKSWAWFSFA